MGQGIRNEGNVYNIEMGQSEGKKLLERSSLEDNIKIDLKELG